MDLGDVISHLYSAVDIAPILLLSGIFDRLSRISRMADSDVWQSPVVVSMREQMREMEEQYQRQFEFFVNFPEVVKAMAGAMTVAEVSAATSRGISALLEPEQIAIFLTHSKGMVRLVDGKSFPDKLRGRLDCSIADSGLKTLLEYRGVQELKDRPSAALFLHESGLRVELAAPVWHGERLFGLIVVSKPKMEEVMAVRVLAMLADLMSVGLHAAGLVAEIRKMAERDALTGLPNRRTLMARVQSELQRCKSYRSKLSLIMIDVDNFKHYNDRNGHAEGDKALKMVASILEKTVRRTDLAARYGGEEFTVLVHQADHEVAFRTAERIRQNVASTPFPHGEHQPLKIVSISMGLATFPDDAGDDTSLFKAADKALYYAKEQGRNRAIIYDKAVHG